MTIRGRGEGGTHGRESGCEVVEWLKSEAMSLKNGGVTTSGVGKRVTEEKSQVCRKCSSLKDEENV